MGGGGRKRGRGGSLRRQRAGNKEKKIVQRYGVVIGTA